MKVMGGALHDDTAEDRTNWLVVTSQRYERASTLVTSNLPFEEWIEVFSS